VFHIQDAGNDLHRMHRDAAGPQHGLDIVLIDGKPAPFHRGGDVYSVFPAICTRKKQAEKRNFRKNHE
jgi:hypothetical protein